MPRCHRATAHKVLTALSDDKVDTLFKRELRLGAIKGTEWPAILRQFVTQPENSRTHPGQDLVTVGRNLPKVPKRILHASKDKLVTEFLAENPTCDFKKYGLLHCSAVQCSEVQCSGEQCLHCIFLSAGGSC